MMILLMLLLHLEIMNSMSRCHVQSWKKVTLSSATATSHKFNVSAGTKINFAVAARDKAGNWSDWTYAGWTKTKWYDEGSGAISYSAGWNRYTNDGAFRDDYKATKAEGASTSFTFTGRAVALSATRWDGAGTADVYLDGKHRGTVSFDNGSTDGSADAIAAEHPEVQLVRNPENVGYAGGHNQGARATTGRFLVRRVEHLL